MCLYPLKTSSYPWYTVSEYFSFIPYISGVFSLNKWPRKVAKKRSAAIQNYMRGFMRVSLVVGMNTSSPRIVFKGTGPRSPSRRSREQLDSGSSGVCVCVCARARVSSVLFWHVHVVGRSCIHKRAHVCVGT